MDGLAPSADLHAPPKFPPSSSSVASSSASSNMGTEHVHHLPPRGVVVNADYAVTNHISFVADLRDLIADDEVSAVTCTRRTVTASDLARLMVKFMVFRHPFVQTLGSSSASNISRSQSSDTSSLVRAAAESYIRRSLGSLRLHITYIPADALSGCPCDVHIRFSHFSGPLEDGPNNDEDALRDLEAFSLASAQVTEACVHVFGLILRTDFDKAGLADANAKAAMLREVWKAVHELSLEVPDLFSSDRMRVVCHSLSSSSSQRPSAS
jgi:hypothetical protein